MHILPNWIVELAIIVARHIDSASDDAQLADPVAVCPKPTVT